MAFRHYARLERDVRIGGRKIKFGPLSWTFGGRDYLVRPLNAFEWLRFVAVIGPYFPGGKISGPQVEVFIKTADVDLPRVFLPLILGDLIRYRDLRRATKDQVLSAWIAFAEVNDLDYIQKAPADPDKVKAAQEAGVSWDDWAVELSVATSGALTPEGFLLLPIQMFLSIAESFGRLKNVSDGRPADAEAPTEKELAEIRAHFEARGIGFE